MSAPLLEAHPEALEALRAEGYPVGSDDALAAAFAAHSSVSEGLARLSLSGGCGEVAPGPDGIIHDYACRRRWRRGKGEPFYLLDDK